VTCGAVFTIGGRVSGLLGSGMVLQNNGGDNLSITASGNFTFPTPLLTGSAYAVTILTAPSKPAQTCTILNGSGTASVNVNNVQIICPQPAFTISGTLVGLVNGPGDTVELQDNAGDDLFVTGNNSTFTFPTQVTNGGIYNVSEFLPATSQSQPCNIFNGFGIATADVTNVLVDCQHNDWNWLSWFVSNSKTSNQYATALLPPPFPDQNVPGGRDFGVTWSDASGRKWLFGGFGFPLTSSLKLVPGYLNDLWFWNGKWVPANLPIFLGLDGLFHADTNPLLFSQNVPGTYGTMGTANPGVNAPGSRWGGASWTDATGNLWMFGGQGWDSSAAIEPGLLNDLWEFQPTGGANQAQAGTFGGQWIWQGGKNIANQPGVYGVQGTAAASNLPGGRWAAATWSDNAGNVFLFGGQGYDAAGKVGFLNDLWKFTISTGQWTWLGPATSNAVNQNGIYGTQGAGTATTAPGSRQAAVLWTDASGNIWLFGGFGLDSAGTGAPDGATLNDLWEFTGGVWTWRSGSNIANQNGVYGTQLAANANNVPGSRWGAKGWSDVTGNLWFFGGWGYDSNALNGTGFLNDVWEYQQSTKQWIWWKGSSDVNQSGAYLTNGIPFVNNVAGARRGMSVWQPDPNGYVTVFGGQGYDASAGVAPGYLDDLWQYLPFP
jgi:hypothetical protein